MHVRESQRQREREKQQLVVIFVLLFACGPIDRRHSAVKSGSQARQSSQAVTCLLGNQGDSWVPCSVRYTSCYVLSPLFIYIYIFWFSLLSLSFQLASVGSVPYHLDIVVSRLATTASVFHTLYTALYNLCEFSLCHVYFTLPMYVLRTLCSYVCMCICRARSVLISSREFVKPPPMRGRRRCQRRFALFTRQKLVTLRVRTRIRSDYESERGKTAVLPTLFSSSHLHIHVPRFRNKNNSGDRFNYNNKFLLIWIPFLHLFRYILYIYVLSGGGGGEIYSTATFYCPYDNPFD